MVLDYTKTELSTANGDNSVVCYISVSIGARG